MKFTNELNEFAINIINTVREPLLVLDKNLRVIKGSRSFYNFFKVTPDETIGKLVYDLGNRQWDIPKLRELLETILPEKTTFDDYEVEHDFSTIGKRVMLLNARQIKRAFGKKKIILLAIEDITERKHAEESLSETSRVTSEYLDILVNHTHVPIIIWDASYVITRINHAFEKLSGYDIHEVIGRKIDFLFPEDKINSTIELLKNSFGEKKFEVIEIDILRKDKDIRTVLWNSANVFDKEGVIIVATIAQDITTHKRTAEAIRVLETRYRRLFESAKDGILILDAETGMIIDANPFLVELLGYSHEKFTEKAIWEIGFFKDIADNENKFFELQQKEYVRYEDLPLETFDGRKINVEFVSNVYLVNHRRVVQCNIRDISERKQAEEKLQASRLITEGIINAIPTRVFWKDKNLVYLGCNKLFALDEGFTDPTEIIGKDDFQMGWRDQAELYREDDLKVIESGISRLLIEEPQTTPEGNNITLLTSKIPLLNSKGEIIGVLGTYIDITERKQAEKVLQQERDFSRTIIQTSPTFFIAIGSDGKAIMMNDSMLKTLGYTLSEVVGMDYLTNFIPVEDREKVSKIFEALVTTNKSILNENSILTKDGRKIIVEWHGKNILKPTGELNYFFGIGIDITERKQSEEALQKSEERYRSVSQSAHDAIITTNSNGIIIDWNKGAQEIFGYLETEISGKKLGTIIPKDNLAEHIKNWERSEQSGGQSVVGKAVELQGLHKNGKEFPIELSLAEWEIPTGKFFTGIIRDITERKHNEAEILMLALSLRSISECVSITDLEDKILFVNESFLKTYGYAENELIGKQISIVRSLNNPPEFVKEILPATKHGERQGELWNKRKDGSEFMVYLSTTIIKDKESKPLGLIVVTKDITEFKQRERELIKAKDSAEQSDKLKSEFLSQMSHEIRTPLSTIVGNVDLLSDSFRKEIFPEAIDFFDNIDIASKRIIRTIDLVLNAAEIQTSGYKPKFIKVDFNSQILNKLFQEHQLSAKQKGLEMIYKCELKETIILADEYSVTQIFANLIDNAIKYTKKGKVEILLEKNKTGKIIVEVKDTGIGISKEFLPRLFDSFTQEEHGNTRKFDGNGLGLSLIKKYCELNNAVIEVESEKNVGSTFRIIFN